MKWAISSFETVTLKVVVFFSFILMHDLLVLADFIDRLDLTFSNVKWFSSPSLEQDSLDELNESSDEF